MSDFQTAYEKRTARRDSGCIEWTGWTDGNGYGVLTINGRETKAHRASWEHHNGRQIPDGMNVLHRCDNPPCVNPEHLFVGTQGDNIRDMVSKGRQNAATGDRNASRKYPGIHTHGAEHHKAKLSADDVAAIRAAHASGESQTALARRYGVVQPHISRIVRHQNRKRG